MLRCIEWESKPKFTDDLRIILRQFSNYDNLKTYLKTKSHDHLLDVLRQLGWNSQKRLWCLKIYPKICHKIILRHRNFCLEIILWHILGKILRQYLWIWAPNFTIILKTPLFLNRSNRMQCTDLNNYEKISVTSYFSPFMKLLQADSKES